MGMESPRPRRCRKKYKNKTADNDAQEIHPRVQAPPEKLYEACHNSRKGLSMYCPICGVERREGFTWCSKCHLSLVDELPAEETTESDNYASIFEGEADSAAVVCAMLENAGIEAWIKDEEEYGVLPNMGPVEVLVHETSRKTALETLEMPQRNAATNYDDDYLSSRDVRSDAYVRNTTGVRLVRKGRNDTSRRKSETHGKGHQGNNQRRKDRCI